MRSVGVAALLFASAVPAATQSLQPFIPVGIVVGAAGGVLPRRELQWFAKMRFNVVAFRDGQTRELRVLRLAALLDPQPGQEPAPVPSSGLASVSSWKSGREVRLNAWREIAKGARGILFDLGMAYTGREDTFEAASEFADNITRNAALFAPLRPRES